MTMEDFRMEFYEAPNAEGLIDADYWDCVFDEIDSPDELRKELRLMEKMGSVHIEWGPNGIPEAVWVSGY